MSQTFIITNAGRAALINAANTGTAPVTISHIGVTATAFVANAAMNALPGEIKRVTTFGGQVVADDVIHVTLNDEGAGAYSLRGFALYLAGGTLFGLYGQATPIAEKTANSNLLLSADVAFEDIDTALIEFGPTEFLNPPATETVVGVLRFSTNAEAQAGVRADTGISPKSLWFVLNAWFTANFSDIWRASNDGSGSGLDSDLLDGQHGAYYANVPARLGYTPANKAGETFEGPIRRDALAYFDLQGGNPVLNFDAGDYLYYSRANNTYYFMIGGQARLSIDGAGVLTSAGQMSAAGQTVWHAGNDGAGSGADADLLDGVQGAQYSRSDIDAQPAYRAKGVPLTDPGIGTGGLWCVSATGLNVARNGTFYRVWDAGNDGAGSGADADLLDGVQGDGYTRNNGVANVARSQGIQVAGNVPGHNFGAAPIQVREINYVGNVTRDAAYAPSIAFHWSGVAAAHLKMYDDGSLRARTNSDDPASYAPFYAATMVSNGGIVWHAANDGAGSGMDSDLLDGQQGGWYADVKARLGYTPIQQGGGAGQGDNVIKIGWSGTRLKAQVDTTDQGNFVFDADFTSGGAAGNGWRKGPDGFIDQWKEGAYDAAGAEGAQQTIYYPIEFPSACYDVQITTQTTVNQNADVEYQLISFDKQKCVVQRQRMSSNDPAATRPRIRAIGK